MIKIKIMKIVTLKEDSYYHCGEFICGRYYSGIYGGEQWVNGVRQIKVDDNWIAWDSGSVSFK